MADWSTAELSTTTSIVKFESEINDLTATNWNNQIAIAKELLGDRLEVVLTERGISVDEAESEVLLNVIANPTVFNLTSDYLTLSLIYDDLSQGMEGLYLSKSEKYKALSKMKFNEDLKRMNLDTNDDDIVDNYRVNWQGKLSR
ncbi:MAG: hypothetical protein HN692_07335 [Candidatus Cloacimonetes bacterium]|jgi:hypothetical protein|nr:hypothetical protein [Candidatus Cloacimonadota bacterium]